MAQVPSSGADSLRLRSLFPALMSCLMFVFSGCEEVKKAVNDAKSEVSGSANTSTPPTTSANATPQTMPSVGASPASAFGPTPAEVIARFQKLASYDITDADLTQLCVTPEVGPSILKIDLTGNRNVTKA